MGSRRARPRSCHFITGRVKGVAAYSPGLHSRIHFIKSVQREDCQLCCPPSPPPPSLPLSRQTVTLLKRFAGQGAGPRPLATSGLSPASFDEAEENDSDSACPCRLHPSAQKRQESTTSLTSTRTDRPDPTLTWRCPTFY